jgi:hypothetical protein
MKTYLMLLAGVALLSVTLLITGCAVANGASAGSLPPIGKPCTIQFRRDALGTAAALPVNPMASSINGAETSVAGTLKMVSPEWVVLDLSGREVWVSKSVVLLIQF